MPDLQATWAKVYGKFDGRLNRVNCWSYCSGKHRCCRPEQTLVLMPGEAEFLVDHGVDDIEGDRWVCPGHDGCLGRSLKPMCCRTFPVHPLADGRLSIKTDCSHHRWASHLFFRNVHAAWGELWKHAEIVAWVEMMRTTGGYSRWTDEIAINEIKRGFGIEYAKIFGCYYNADLTAEIVSGQWLKPGDKVLDAGCGAGVRVRDLRRQGIWAWGIDINPMFVNEHCDVGDVRAMPYSDGYFDAVLSVDVLEHLPDYEQALAEMRRVCRDKMIIAVTTKDVPWNLYEDPTHCVEMNFSEWLDVFKRYGEIVHTAPFYWCVIQLSEGKDG